MEAPPAGAIVLVRFPFSDLSRAVLRPAVVLADAGRGDFVLCQVTSNPYADPRAIELTQESLRHGSLQRTSYARPGKLFTAHQRLIGRRVAELGPDVRKRILDSVIALLVDTKSL